MNLLLKLFGFLFALMGYSLLVIGIDVSTEAAPLGLPTFLFTLVSFVMLVAACFCTAYNCWK